LGDRHQKRRRISNTRGKNKEIAKETHGAKNSDCSTSEGKTTLSKGNPYSHHIITEETMRRTVKGQSSFDGMSQKGLQTQKKKKNQQVTYGENQENLKGLGTQKTHSETVGGSYPLKQLRCCQGSVGQAGPRTQKEQTKIVGGELRG